MTLIVALRPGPRGPVAREGWSDPLRPPSLRSLPAGASSAAVCTPCGAGTFSGSTGADVTRSGWEGQGAGWGLGRCAQHACCF